MEGYPEKGVASTAALSAIALAGVRTPNFLLDSVGIFLCLPPLHETAF